MQGHVLGNGCGIGAIVLPEHIKRLPPDEGSR
jgi:hypothetical protein